MFSGSKAGAYSAFRQEDTVSILPLAPEPPPATACALQSCSSCFSVHTNASVIVAAAEVEKAENVSSKKFAPRGPHRKRYWNNSHKWFEGTDAVTVFQAKQVSAWSPKLLYAS